MTGLAFVGGTDIYAIKNKKFLRIETDKAKEIVVALDKSGVPFSARYNDKYNSGLTGNMEKHLPCYEYSRIGE